MITVELKPLQHRKQECIAILFKHDTVMNTLIKKIPGIQWSNSNKCWYIAFTETNRQNVYHALNGKAEINAVPMKFDTQENSAVQHNHAADQPIAAYKKKETTKPAAVLHRANKEALELFVQRLQLKAYSPLTIKTYRNEFLQLLQILKTKPAKELTAADLKRYMVYAMEKEGISENTAHSRLNALKFYYEQVLNKERFFWEIPRPKKPQILPKLLNETELAKLFNALTNKKHKAMLFTAYSAGLRVSEIVNLKIADIDSKRMQIFIERAKGKKDRYVNLSPVLLDILRKYIKEYQPGPKVYLFESEQTLTAYPARTVQQIFANAKAKARIKKDVGIHSLRHSFATHLLDKGTDIKYIKELLGHFNIKTTERYLHVSKRQLVNIISPLDDLMTKEEIEW